MNLKRKVNVSDLSYFIDNPDRYLENKGEAYNKEAAVYGTKFHDKKLQTKYVTLKTVGILLVCGLIAIYFLST
jgi:hypothetical protein